MKHLIFFLFGLISIQSMAQDKPEAYTASNGITYRPGDQIQIGVGSNTNGDFKYIAFASQMLFATLTVITGQNANPYLQASANGQVVDIKKIKEHKGKYFLVVQVDDQVPYLIDIENAIKECEVAYCRNGEALSQEQFEKLILVQQFYEDGKVTKERFTELRQQIMESVSVEESTDPTMVVPEKN